jgi:hypothetical protein
MIRYIFNRLVAWFTDVPVSGRPVSPTKRNISLIEPGKTYVLIAHNAFAQGLKSFAPDGLMWGKVTALDNSFGKAILKVDLEGLDERRLKWSDLDLKTAGKDEFRTLYPNIVCDVDNIRLLILNPGQRNHDLPREYDFYFSSMQGTPYL